MSRVAPFAAGLALGLGIALAWVTLRPASPAVAVPGHAGAPIQDVLDHHAEALGVDRDTVTKARALANDARDELDGHRNTIRTEKAELTKLLDAAEVDRTQMAAVVAKISEAERQLRTRELEVMLAIRQLLTPAQIEALTR